MLKKLTLATTIGLLLSSNVFADGLTLTAGDFVQNNDGTVTHTPTGLIWQACSVGQTWDSNTGTCTGEATNMNYSDAIALTSNFAGQTDWRIPNIAELHSLVDLKKSQPAVNKSLFPQTPQDYFVSSSTYTPNSRYQIRVGFSYGDDGYNSSGYIRFVRGATVSPVISLKDFVDNGDATVTHNKTGLTWQRCAVGQTWNNGSCDGKAATYKQTDALKLTADTGGKTDWRLPTYKELLTIVDYSAYSPAVNVIVFPDAPSVQFWTTTQMAGDYYTSNSWYVNFDNGQGSYGGKSNNYAVRLVRGSTAIPPITTSSVDLVPTITATPNPATVNGNITFTATLANKGSGTATDAKLSFALPKNTVSLVTKPDECIFTGLSVVCSVGNLVPNGSITKAVTVKMTKAGGLSFGVTSWSAEKDVNPKDNIARATMAIRK
ncbi:MAG: DUF1566 domain-containing protein [Methylococcales bacterium]|nr:DUF1566 domain-containing protein [Methylococcales bacterium]MDD5754858.1 DUF1566 domain-containing protein [Methylococcales bacterium]